MKKTRLLKTYSSATRLLAPTLPFWLKRRAGKGKEDPARLRERNGITNIPRPRGHIIWMHAASVGESQMLMPIIRRLLTEHPDFHIVITTGTVTSAELLEKQLPTNAHHQYAPADHPKAVGNFLGHWKPDMALFAESELWPNMIMLTKELGIPMALINARMSASSIQRWAKRGKKSGQALLSCFELILAADTQTADGLSWLLEKDIECSGNLKDAAPALDVDKNDLQKLKSALTRRRIWCATSTHKGEEDLIAKAAVDIKKIHPNAILILAPRHPERAKEIKDILTKAGLRSLRRSSHRLPTAKTDVYIIDGMGELGLVYRLAKIGLIGGSLVEGLSGHNPLEPARLGCAIITGKHISSFADAYMALFGYGAATRIFDPSEISSCVLTFFKDENLRKAHVHAALKYATSQDAVLDYVWGHLMPLLPRDIRPG